ncbi:MAG: hypothetical protein K1X94_34385, partial [Sandaracinaceae bacterium]|nr:hypothetical protein [Sandaracinaceae bacterium]
ATEAPARTAPARTAPARTEPAGTATSEAPSELALLGRARAALATHPEVTLALCAEHASRYPEGVLREEREVLAIDALVATGRESQARARAVRFEAAFPQSVHRPHVSQALERFDAPSAAR